MAYSDLNYVSPKMLKAVFGITDRDFTMLTVEGKFSYKRKYKNPLILMDSVAALYQDRDNMVLKRWGYDYDSPKDKYKKMIQSSLKGMPRCFFRVSEDIPEAYYRIFYKGISLKICLFVFDGYAMCMCFSRNHEDYLEQIFHAFEEGKIDIEG